MGVKEGEGSVHVEELEVIPVGRSGEQCSGAPELSNGFRPTGRWFVVALVDDDEYHAARELGIGWMAFPVELLKCCDRRGPDCRKALLRESLCCGCREQSNDTLGSGWASLDADPETIAHIASEL